MALLARIFSRLSRVKDSHATMCTNCLPLSPRNGISESGRMAPTSAPTSQYFSKSSKHFMNSCRHMFSSLCNQSPADDSREGALCDIFSLISPAKKNAVPSPQHNFFYSLTNDRNARMQHHCLQFRVSPTVAMPNSHCGKLEYVSSFLLSPPSDVSRYVLFDGPLEVSIFSLN
jgi:hypothetical protein